MPWQGEAADGKVYKYQYHPHGDKNQPLRAAPSAMNTVIVPNVTLPEVCCSYPLAGPFALATVIAYTLCEHLIGTWRIGPNMYFPELLTIPCFLIGPPREVQQARQGGVGLLNGFAEAV